jgi:PKD repeat protein
VSLEVSNAAGDEIVTCTDYIAVYEPVQADFTAAPRQAIAPATVQFTDTSTGPVAAWTWDFGDGETSALQHPTHTYEAAGMYTVSLTARAAGGSALWPGGTDTVTRTGYITVHEAVAADFSASPVSGTLPLEVTFTNQSTGAYTETLWHFGDGVTSTQESPTHTYTSAGVYTVTLDVSGPGGSDSLARENYITVSAPPAPIADFTASPVYGTLPLEVAFTNQSTGAYTETLWHFGDGVTSTQESPTHTYTSAGVYTVTLDVSGPGGSDTLSRPNYITVEGGFDVFLPLVVRKHHR